MTPEHRAAAIVEQAAAGYLGWREQCDRIAAAIRAAVAAEREACAKLAESWGDPHGVADQIRARGQS